MAVHTYWDEQSGTPYALNDDALVLPADATEADRRHAGRRSRRPRCSGCSSPSL
jgi:hypothetical protein